MKKMVGLWRMDETSRDGMLWRPQFFYGVLGRF